MKKLTLCTPASTPAFGMPFAARVVRSAHVWSDVTIEAKRTRKGSRSWRSPDC